MSEELNIRSKKKGGFVEGVPVPLAQPINTGAVVVLQIATTEAAVENPQAGMEIAAEKLLVKTLLDLVFVILIHRNRNSGLVLNELGDHLLGGERGPAGVKRIASLLHSVKWKSTLIMNYLWQCHIGAVGNCR